MGRESRLAKRDTIQKFQDLVAIHPDAEMGDSCPLNHDFVSGIYVRTIRIPKGTMGVGKIHKHEHPNFLLDGIVDVFTEEEGLRRLVAPLYMISPAGTKRVVYAVEDCTWMTMHATDKTTPEEAEEEVIAKDYKELI